MKLTDLATMRDTWHYSWNNFANICLNMLKGYMILFEYGGYMQDWENNGQMFATHSFTNSNTRLWKSHILFLVQHSFCPRQINSAQRRSGQSTQTQNLATFSQEFHSWSGLSNILLIHEYYFKVNEYFSQLLLTLSEL